MTARYLMMLALGTLLGALLGTLLGIAPARAQQRAVEVTLGPATDVKRYPQLYGRARLAPQVRERLELTAEDRGWLWRRGTLRLGVSEPDFAPFEVLADGDRFEGLTADYLGLLADLLRVNIEVIRYADRQQAIAALRTREVDLLGSSNAFEATVHDLVLSAPYAADQPTVVTRSDTLVPARKDPETERLAVLQDYLPEALLKGLYPDATLVSYPSVMAALVGVSVGEADMFLGNALASSNLLAKGTLNNLQLAHFPATRLNHLGFALRPGDSHLLAMLNAGLDAIDLEQRARMVATWNGGVAAASLEPAQPLDLSPAERRWIERHPRVRVVMKDGFVPFGWHDGQGRFRGIGADLLARIAQRTGLSFEPAEVGSIDAMVEQVRGGQADMLLALTASSEREQWLSFSRPYTMNAPVLITAEEEDAPASLEAMTGKRLAMPPGNYVAQLLAAKYPGIRMVDTGSYADSLEAVADGRADATILAMVNARAIIAQQYAGVLQMKAPVPLPPTRHAFATARGNTELLGILNKALLSFSPAELDELVSRWRGEVIVANPRQPVPLHWLMGSVGSMSLVIFATFGWSDFLRRQIRRRFRAEGALTDQLEFMRVMIDGTPHPIYVRGRDGSLLNCNASYLEALQVDRDTVIGQRVAGSVPLSVDQADFFDSVYRQVMADGLPLIEDRELAFANGDSIMAYHWMLPYRSSDGEIVGIIAGWIDITERQALLHAYQQAKEQADAASEAKSRFLATASHEIRTPMNAVLGLLEMALKTSRDGPMDRVAVEVAYEAARGLLELLNDILDISRIEAGHLELAPQVAALDAEVRAVASLFEGQAQAKGLRLRLEVGPCRAWSVWVDPMRFKQVLNNVLSNAIKFTEQGEVVMALQACVEQGALHAVLTVTDTGIGIPRGELESLGEPWRQANNHGQGPRAGAGLGLNVSQQLCALMGGTFSLQSEVGQGTRVEIDLRLPLCPTSNGVALPGSAAPTRALDILVVDDYAPNRMLLDQQLRFLGHRVTLAQDGESGLRTWLNGRFEVVICDCNMPGLDGYALTRALREEEQRTQRTPCRILAYTANAQEAEQRRCLEAGMDACLLKPLSLNDLAEALSVARGGAPLPDIEVGSLLQLAGGEPALALVLRDKLLDSVRADLEKLASMRELGSRYGLAELAHRIKGGARIVSAHSVVDACEAVERDPLAFDAMIHQVQRFIHALEAFTGQPA